MSLISNAYIIGNNVVGSQIRVSVSSDSDKPISATYQWYRSSSYTGLYESIPYATHKTYKIALSDKYLKCEVKGNGAFTNSVFTDILVVNQLEVETLNKSRNNTTLANIGKGLNQDQLVSQVSGSSIIINDIARINQSIKIILSTAKGEVPMIPQLGTNLHTMLFSETTDDFLSEVEDEVLGCLEEQEPRINVIDVEVDYDEEHTVLVIINYSIKNTNIQTQYIYNIDTGGDN